MLGTAVLTVFSPGLLWGSSVAWVEARLLSSISAGQLPPKGSVLCRGVREVRVGAGEVRAVSPISGFF